MSYVRWSTPLYLPEGMSALDYYMDHDGKDTYRIPTSDFYIYEHVGGFFSVNMAGNRRTPVRPSPGTKDREAWFAWLEEGRKDIDHPAAGQTFEFKTMKEVIAKVEELVAEGFLAPDYLLDALREEEDAEAGEPYAEGY